MYTYKYPRPAVTTDTVVFNYIDNEIKVLLIQRGKEPFKGMWATPGGFLEMDETGEVGAKRELLEETGLKVESVYFSHIADSVDRDPRGRIISLIYYAFMVNSSSIIQGGDDATNAQWFTLFKLPNLACDHKQNINLAIMRFFENLRLESNPLLISNLINKDVLNVKRKIQKYLNSSKLC